MQQGQDEGGLAGPEVHVAEEHPGRVDQDERRRASRRHRPRRTAPPARRRRAPPAGSSRSRGPPASRAGTRCTRACGPDLADTRDPPPGLRIGLERERRQRRAWPARPRRCRRCGSASHGTGTRPRRRRRDRSGSRGACSDRERPASRPSCCGGRSRPRRSRAPRERRRESGRPPAAGSGARCRASTRAPRRRAAQAGRRSRASGCAGATRKQQGRASIDRDEHQAANARRVSIHGVMLAPAARLFLDLEERARNSMSTGIGVRRDPGHPTSPRAVRIGHRDKKARARRAFRRLADLVLLRRLERPTY